MKSTGLAYLLWCLGLVGLCGIHRFYAGKVFTGIIWLCTFGLLGIGQLIDLLLIPGMITNANLRAVAFGNRNTNTNVNHIVVNVPAYAPAPQQAQK
ncbi:MAG: NINE protein [Planctomycetaceae bacterium]|nr:MAG: NINE protein [Planctomycetaceae bacterium]